ncbi:primosomal protein N' [Bacteroidia bacterium]|nr:primosomal protein N' [Bacteroidia bacterium]MDB9882098.1 primosomal protein N' [Bacteroidia bacterium]MDC1395330.1 primosomal protein N' [Bacteroidia bacterium]
MDTLDDRQTLFIEVLLPLNLQNTFTYRVPYELNEEVIVGKRVSVPFGKNKVMAGLIYKIGETPPTLYQAKYILDIVDSEPIVSETQLELWTWIAHYYMSSLGLVYNAAMPAGLKMEGESKMVLHPDIDHNLSLDPKEYIIVESLKANKEISIAQASSLLKIKQIHKYVKSLYLKGIILLKEDINEIYKPKNVNYIKISNEVQSDNQLNILFDELEKRAKKQLKALMTFIAKYSITGEAEKTELVKHDVTNAAINALVDKGIFIQENRVKSRIVFTDQKQELEDLEKEQQQAYHNIQMAFVERRPALLFGVTSSGKTHVYAHLIKENLDKGRQVLYLLPEIALTSQLIERLQHYFGEQLVVSHSKFSNNERVEVYQAVQGGKPLLIVGTRSAIFQPFENLGLIIVDEEHESSFKQHEPAPRFHARDTALYLAAKRKANILLGSATPAVESYYNAQQGKYDLVKLLKRYDNAILPKIEVVDMQQQKKQKRTKGIFSDTLLDAISGAKQKGKQVILFQNKKGYVPVLECNVCAWTPKCQNCDISLTYYKYQENLRCHYCGYTQEVVNKCVTCGNTGIELIGYGTERIEDELVLYLPDIKVKRMDYNTTRLKNSHTKLIQEFSEGRIDVLIGTQMVAKGLDFENVSTVGILNADHLINFPDFRANERAFQLITQVAGRAGRRKEQGKVYIQTSKPDHFVIKQIVENDYTGMYESELSERMEYDYPPFHRLIKVTLKHKDALHLYKLGQITKNHLISFFGASLLGPEKPYVSKIRNWYILNFVLKIENNGSKIREQKHKLSMAVAQLEKNKEFSQARIVVDVDPI